MTAWIKQRLFSGWHLARWIALGAGLFLGIQAFWYGDGLAAALSAFFLFQALTNSGCLGSPRGCGIPLQDSSPDNKSDKIEFSEIKE